MPQLWSCEPKEAKEDNGKMEKEMIKELVVGSRGGFGGFANRVRIGR